MNEDTQVAQDQGTTWLNFALGAQCKQRPSGTRTSSRVSLPTLQELRDKAQNIIQQRQEKEKAADSEDSDSDKDSQGVPYRPFVICHAMIFSGTMK